MIALAFIIGLLLGLIIGYILGKKSTSSPGDTKSPDHDLSDSQIKEINRDLLSEGGKFQVQLSNGETIRYISFIDALLMDLDDTNKHLILDHCQNLDSAINILEQAQRDKNPDFLGFTAVKRREVIEKIEGGERCEFELFSKLCPPPDKPPRRELNEALLWGPEAMLIIANAKPKISVDIRIKDPLGKFLEVKQDGLIYDFGEIVVENNQTGIHTIEYKIRDLELGKTASFEQEFSYKASRK